MPRTSVETVSNADQAKELPALVAQAKEVYWPPTSHKPPSH